MPVAASTSATSANASNTIMTKRRSDADRASRSSIRTTRTIGRSWSTDQMAFLTAGASVVTSSCARTTIASEVSINHDCAVVMYTATWESRIAIAPILPWHRNRDVAVLHSAGVIALNVKRAGLAFPAVERPARDARDLLVVHGLDAIAKDGHPAAHQGNVVIFPFARLARQLHGWSEETVDGAHAVELVVRLQRFIFHLNFIARTKVNPAVAFIWAVVFNVQLEVLEHARTLQVGAVLFVHQFAVPDHPVVVRRGDRFPSGQVLAVEQRLGRSPSGGHRTLQGGSPYTGQFPLHGIPALDGAHELFAVHGEIPGGRRSSIGGGYQGQSQVRSPQFYIGRHSRAGRARLDESGKGAIRLLDLHPIGVCVPGCGDRDIPSAHERIALGGGKREQAGERA